MLEKIESRKKTEEDREEDRGRLVVQRQKELQGMWNRGKKDGASCCLKASSVSGVEAGSVSHSGIHWH